MPPSSTRTDRINDPNKGSDTVWCRPRADPRAVLACAYRIQSPEQFPFPGNCTLSPSLPFYPCNIRPFRPIYNRQREPATCTGRAHRWGNGTRLIEARLHHRQDDGSRFTVHGSGLRKRQSGASRRPRWPPYNGEAALQAAAESRTASGSRPVAGRGPTNDDGVRLANRRNGRRARRPPHYGGQRGGGPRMRFAATSGGQDGRPTTERANGRDASNGNSRQAHPNTAARGAADRE
jgi:hypothetical protein